MPAFGMVIARRLARTGAAASGMVAAEGRREALHPAGEIGREVNLLELLADPCITALRAG